MWVSFIFNSSLIFLFILELLDKSFGYHLPQSPLIKLPLEERITYYGYPVEIHQVTTEDNYILSLYRIPHGVAKKSNKVTNKSVVLLLHGMGGSPKNFFTLGNDSIGFGLVEHEFDVWALCFRGMECAHKQNHKTLDRDKDKIYWRFTLNELGYYDLPASIDYVRNKTGQKKLFLLGHSAGSTVQFILLSQRPEYNEKVKIGASYGPTIFFSHMKYPVLRFAGSLVGIGKGLWSKIIKDYEFLPKGFMNMFTDFFKTACGDSTFLKICEKTMSAIGSHTSVLIDTQKYIQFIVSDAVFRLPVMQVFHYADMINSGNFTKYDYGNKKNMKYYGQPTPPHYNLSQVTCPIAFFYGPNDEVGSVGNIKRAIGNLPNVIVDYKVPFRKFNHIDYIYASNASKLVYEPTYELFKNYDKGIVPETVKTKWKKRIINKTFL